MRRSTTTLRKSGASFQKDCCTCISAALHQHRAALSTADAEGCDAAAPAGSLEHLQHVQHEARARGADGVADRDRAAVDVELAAVELAESAVEPEVRAAIILALPRREACEHLAGERLVDLDRVDVVPA